MVDADPALVALLDEWLDAVGIKVVDERAAGTDAGQRYQLAIVDVPFPRQDGMSRIARVASAYPGTPLIAVSAAFFPGVVCCGAVTRTFGVACALPKPVSREALLRAARRLLPP